MNFFRKSGPGRKLRAAARKTGVAFLLVLALVLQPLGTPPESHGPGIFKSLSSFLQRLTFPWEARAEELDPTQLPPLPVEDRTETPTVYGSFDNSPLPGDWVPSDPGNGFDLATSVLLSDQTTPYRAKYANQDGTLTDQYTTRPVRFRDATGVWRDYDLDLVARGNATFGAEAGPDLTVFAAQADGVTARTDVDGATFLLGHPEALSVSGSVSGPTITYPGAFSGNRDLQLTLTTQGFKENVILNSPGAPSSYTDKLIVAPGISTRQAGNQIEFLNATGEVIARFGGGFAFDSSPTEEPPSTPVVPALTSQNGLEINLSFSIDEAWLRDAARVYPITIDPIFSASGNDNAIDTSVRSQYPGSTFSSGYELYVGHNNQFNADGSPAVSRALLRFDIPTQTMSGVTDSKLEIFNSTSWSDCVNALHDQRIEINGLGADGLGAAFTASTTWNSQPPLDENGTYYTSGNFANYSGRAGYTPNCPGQWYTFPTTNLARRWIDEYKSDGVTQKDNFGFMIAATDEGDAYGWKKFWARKAPTGQIPKLSITYNDRRPDPSQPLSPADGTLTMSGNLNLTATPATDPDGDKVQYYFRIATGPDAESGNIVANSGWLDQPNWTPPIGAFDDGVTYYWHVLTGNSTSAAVRKPDWAWKFKVNKRLGTAGPSPYDSIGPVSVNLATGNMNLTFSSRSVSTVGGPIQLTYGYNSADTKKYGLTGSYFADTNADRLFNDGNARLVRRDPKLYGNWAGGPPAPGLPSDNFLARWTGWVTVPSSGQYTFGAASDDGVRIWVNDQLVLDSWVPQGITTKYGNAITVGPTDSLALKIKVEYFEATGAAAVWLLAKTPSFPNGIEVPGEWLSPDHQPLPLGWTLTGGGYETLSYTSAKVVDKAVTILEPDGEGHTYSWTSSGWTPPVGEQGVLSQNSAGQFTLQEDGMTYLFDPAGSLLSATPVPDAGNPAAATYTYAIKSGAGWTGQPSRLTEIIDPLSQQKVLLSYGGDTQCASPPTGFDAPSTASLKLCKIAWPDGEVTTLFYKSGRLSRIVEPGSQVLDFGYSGNLINRIRTPLGADMVTHPVTSRRRADDDTVRFVVGYDTSDSAKSVTAPVPLPGEQAPQHSYTIGLSQSVVQVAGISVPARTVQFDSAGRLTSDTDATTRTTTQTWDSLADRVTSSTSAGRVDAPGLKTTYLYDFGGRLTDTYGPAPAGWFNSNGTPTSGNSAATPHSIKRYDEGVISLAATYFPNKDLQGSPKCHETGVGAGDGAIYRDWGLGAPSCLGPQVDNWSGRYTGEILLPQAGTYTFRLYSDDGVRLFIDDKKVVERWIDQSPNWSSGTFNNATANTRHRIQLEYYENGGGARLELHWTQPDGSQLAIPGTNLSPAYGLVTSSIDADGKKTKTEYVPIERGLATASIVDPDGLNLRSTTSYDIEYKRRIARTLPKGDLTRRTYSYYTNSATADNPCTTAVESAGQAGLLKSETDPAPSSGPTIQREYVYDTLGRVVARKVLTDSIWSCLAYDSRGRITSDRDSAGKTTTNTYTNPDEVVSSYPDPDAPSNTLQTSERVDLLQRPIRYVDEHGTVHRYEYDRAGRLTRTYRQFGGKSEALLQQTDYDDAGRIKQITDYSASPTSPRVMGYTYDPAGRLQTETRPNNVATTTTYNSNYGWVSDIANSAESRAWTYNRSLAGRVSSEIGPPHSRNFTYDGAGRLIRTDQGSETRLYAYDANSNRCAKAATCSTPTYFYDNADRLTSSPFATSYTYDPHGNLTSAGRTGSPGLSNLPPTSWPYDTLPSNQSNDKGARTYKIGVGSSGTINASLDWNSLAPITSTSTGSGSLGAGSSSSGLVEVAYQQSYVASSLSWDEGPHEVPNVTTNSVPTSGATRGITTEANGRIQATASWPSVRRDFSDSGAFSGSGSRDVDVPVSANGPVHFSLTFPTGSLTGFVLQLLDPTGVPVATSTETTGNTRSVNHQVSSIASYPTTLLYKLRVTAAGPGDPYSLSGFWWATPNVNVVLENSSGQTIATSQVVNGQPTRRLEYTDAAAEAYVFRFSTDLPVTVSLSEAHQVLDFADLTFALREPGEDGTAGPVVATTRSSSGSASLSFVTSQDGYYVLTINNNSTDIAVPNYGFPTSVTMLGEDSFSGSLTPSQSVSHDISPQAAGYVSSSLTWDRGTRSTTDSVGGSLSTASTRTHTITSTGDGDMSATIDWNPTIRTVQWNSTVGMLESWERTITASATGELRANLSWTNDLVPNNLDLYLVDPSNGSVLQSSESVTDSTEQVIFHISGLTYPSTRQFILRVVSKAGSQNFSLQAQIPVTANVDLELFNSSGTKVAHTTGSAKPETVSASSLPAGTYTLKVISRDYGAAYSGTTTYAILDFASLTLKLKDQAGTTLATVTGASGEQTLATEVPADGIYRLQVQNDSPVLGVPMYNLNARLPADPSSLKLTLKAPNGSTISETDSTPLKPKTIQKSVTTTGAYELVVTPVFGKGTATIGASFPGRPPGETITYDGRDHATSISDGSVTVYETLSPSGRVIRRRVVDAITGEEREKLMIGYANGGDSAAYAIDEKDPNRKITTYVAGPTGLTLIDQGGVPTYPLRNDHGDIVGTTDAAGLFTASPPSDEFGIQTAPNSRLGWLGTKERFFTGGNLNLIRMGVRLYDPQLGRFLSVDPVEGGSANDYEYVSQDPCNNYDLDGRSQQTVTAPAGKIIRCAKWVKFGADLFGWGFAFRGGNALLKKQWRTAAIQLLGGGAFSLNQGLIEYALKRAGRTAAKVGGAIAGFGYVATAVDGWCVLQDRRYRNRHPR